MEKDGLEYLAKQAVTAASKRVITTENGDTFIPDDISEWHRNNHAKEPLNTHTLSSIIDYLKSGADGRGHLFIHVIGPEEVDLLGNLNEYGEREQLVVAKTSGSPFEFGYWNSIEDLNIYLQSQFDDSDDRDALLKFSSNLTESNDKTLEDNGVSQVAYVKKGVASIGKGKVPNPVTLKPYRTFAEVDQPASQFIFRVREGMQAALFEADNGAWKNQAIINIKNYFQKAISSHKITILA